MMKAERECRQMWLAYVVAAPVGSDVWHLQGQWDAGWQRGRRERGEEGKGMVMRMVLFVSGLKWWGVVWVLAQLDLSWKKEFLAKLTPLQYWMHWRGRGVTLRYKVSLWQWFLNFFDIWFYARWGFSNLSRLPHSKLFSKPALFLTFFI